RSVRVATSVSQVNLRSRPPRFPPLCESIIVAKSTAPYCGNIHSLRMFEAWCEPGPARLCRSFHLLNPKAFRVNVQLAVSTHCQATYEFHHVLYNDTQT